MWTFGRKLTFGFAITVVLLIGIGSVAYRAIDTITRTSGWVTHTHQVLEHLALMLTDLREAESAQRGFIITGNETFLDGYGGIEASLGQTVKEVRELTADNPMQQQRLDQVEPLVAGRIATLSHNLEVRRKDGFDAASRLIADGPGPKLMTDLHRLLAQMEAEERSLMKVRQAEADAAADSARYTIIGGTLLALLLAVGAALTLSRSLSGQIGSAVSHVQSSSVELQASASQQVGGTKQQATAMSEITTTMSELLATSRQIAESAQRVAQIASETASASRGGDQTMRRADDAVSAIRHQVDQIVQHMLELGKKSQQIGGILEIINELSEQTNILAINATIEAVGAGEMGKRFSVVADEIRKLADRVSGSTRQIRSLVDDIRTAVNTSVMATEGGSKAVENGAQQFRLVVSSFEQINGMVKTTTEAAREIELSTKQQATAIEQVNAAVANVAQASRESEASSSQTLQTASQLATLSRELALLIRPEARA